VIGSSTGPLLLEQHEDRKFWHRLLWRDRGRTHLMRGCRRAQAKVLLTHLVHCGATSCSLPAHTTNKGAASCQKTCRQKVTLLTERTARSCVVSVASLHWFVLCG
jgi:hypothetical protein